MSSRLRALRDSSLSEVSSQNGRVNGVADRVIEAGDLQALQACAPRRAGSDP